MRGVFPTAFGAAFAACACAACSFSPDVAGSRIDCSDGKPCPEGWICPETGSKVCIPIETARDSGAGANADGGAKGDGGGGADGREPDTGGACRDRCPSKGTVECASASSYRVCGIGGDGCLAWGAEQYCTGKCADDQCEGCTVDCAQKDCGDDGCSGSCGSCTRPPPDACKDNHTLSEYGADGTCADSICVYTPKDTDCPYGCGNGKCTSCAPSCAAKECGDDGCGTDCGLCDRPPTSSCLNANTLRHYDPSGACQGGACNYTYSDIFCQNGCSGAQCENCAPTCAGRQCGSDGCGGDCGACGAYAICNGAGQCECADGNRLNCNGTWSDGCEVDRNADRFNCGNCGNACALANTAVVGCSGGACKVVACAQDFGNCNGQDADGCESGLSGDPDNCGQCGKKCNTPPSSACLADGKTLRSYDARGTCAGSACSYTPRDTVCTNACANAQCTGCQPSCAGKSCGDDGCGGSCGTCNSPPADTCAGPGTLRRYNASGTCNAGFACDYSYSDTSCPYGCSGAQCQGCSPSCAGKSCGDDGCGGSCGTCDSPPPDACVNANTLRSYNASGTCSAGFTCDYAYTDTNCPNGCSGAQCQGCSPSCAGKACGDDGCGGSCGGCNSPPADSCISGKTIRQYRSPGSCNAGFQCDYPFKDTDCLNDCAGDTCVGCSCLGKICGDDDGCGGTCGDP